MIGRFEMLLDRFQGGEATPEELAELEALLRTHPDKRRILVERVLLEVQLYKAFNGIAPVQQGPASPVRLGWFVPVGSAAAVLLLALSAWLIFYPYLGTRAGPVSVIESGQVRAGNAAVSRIASDVPFVVEGTEVAVVRLSDGSRAELDPATEAIVHTRAGAARPVVELAQGGGKFSVPPGQGQFRVETPLGTVAVLGTEFTVRIGTQKNAAGKETPALLVAVHSGKVEVHSGGKAHLLAAGGNRVFPEPDELLADNPKQKDDAGKDDQRPERINAVLRTVASAKNSITVTTIDEGEVVDCTFRLTLDVAVIVNARPATVGDLRLGKQVRLKLSADRQAVVEIQQEIANPDDPGPNEIVAKLKSDKDADSKDRNDKDADSKDRSDKDTDSKDKGDKDKSEGPGKGPRDIHGAVKAVDAARGTITITRKEKGAVGDRTYNLIDGVPVYAGAVRGTLNDLARGVEVNLHLSANRQTVIEIRIERKKGKS
jgi:ferric-dicitrate binding protein FerR (iron transport regulator)